MLVGLSHLKHLGIAANYIPAGELQCFSSLTSLRRLDMRSCRLTAPPEGLSRLTLLTWLSLHDNQIDPVSTVPFSFVTMTRNASVYSALHDGR